MERNIVWLIILLMGNAVIGGWFVLNESYKPISDFLCYRWRAVLSHG